MKANELRIGNFVLQDGEFIQGIVSNTIHRFALDQIHLEPIPLTKEWVFKFGFIETDKDNIFIHESLRYSDKFKLRDDGVLVFVSSEVYITDCTYVHNLQNLYFALTNEELIYENKNEN